MRTTSLEPPFPLDLGSWLANFRHRRRDSRGHPFSPEQLGREIGVSGATIRRWESGRLRPNASDAANLASAYRLTPNQTSFLQRALRQPAGVPPSVDLFRERAERVLRSDFPAYMVDTLYYIRAWNSYLSPILANADAYLGGKHIIEYILDTQMPPDQRPAWEARVRRMTREFWYFTADFTALEPYRRLVLHLATWPIFKDEWCRLPFVEEDEEQIIGAPPRTGRPSVGSFRLVTSLTLIPPIYQLREFMPLDDRARATVDKLHESGPPVVYFDKHSHWSESTVLVMSGPDHARV